MGKVRLKFPAWFASMLNAKGSDLATLEQEIGEGATVGDLLTDLASSYTDFRKVVFNPDVGKVGDQLIVFLNNSLLQRSDVTEAKLSDGDSVTILPVYTGG